MIHWNAICRLFPERKTHLILEWTAQNYLLALQILYHCSRMGSEDWRIHAAWSLLVLLSPFPIPASYILQHKIGCNTALWSWPQNHASNVHLPNSVSRCSEELQQLCCHRDLCSHRDRGWFYSEIQTRSFLNKHMQNTALKHRVHSSVQIQPVVTYKGEKRSPDYSTKP